MGEPGGPELAERLDEMIAELESPAAAPATALPMTRGRDMTSTYPAGCRPNESSGMAAGPYWVA